MRVITRHTLDHKRRVAVGAGFFCAVLLCLPPARGAAQEPNAIDISWAPADASCPDTTFVRSEVGRFLGTAAAATPDKNVVVHSRVTRAGETFRVELTLVVDGAKENRIFVGESCHAVATATALVTALAVNPAKVMATRAERESVTPPKPPPPSPPDERKTTAPPPAMPRSPKIVANVRWLLDIGTAPTTMWGLGVSLGAAFGALRLEATGALEPSQESSLTSKPDVGARFRAWRVGARACGEWPPRAFAIGGCLGGEYVLLSGASHGIRQPSAATVGVVEVQGGLFAVYYFLNSLGLRIDGSLGLPLARREFTIDPIGVVHRVAPLAGRIGVGLAVRF
jgi:hypothetical protein